MQIRTKRHLVPALAGLMAAAACQDLNVTNLNDSDRERSMATAADVETLIGSAFNVWLAGVHQEHVANLFMNYATEFSSTTNVGAFWTEAQEPRLPHGNLVSIPAGVGPWGPRNLWRAMLATTSIADDLLRVLDENPQLRDELGAGVPRATAFAKFVQGMAWGYKSIVFDQALAIPETEPFPRETMDGIPHIRPRAEVLTMALASLEAAKTIAQQNAITFPARSQAGGTLWFGGPQAMNSAQFIQLINTMQARLVVLNARTPAERAGLDWNWVLARTEAGLTSDFSVELDASRSSIMLEHAQNEAAGCISCYRWHNRLIGQADTSGAYQAWLGKTPAQRDTFDIHTPDRRITGPTSRTAGAYTRYLATIGAFSASRQSYFRSSYQWRRHANRLGKSPATLANTGFNEGAALIATADENRLYRAEALYYLNRRDEAAQLINVTRTRSHTLPNGNTYPGLPPVTAAGVPQSTGCVPRTDSGACGSLLVALRYERMIENAGLDAVRGWADSRAFGLLIDGSYYELPIPGNELNQFGMPLYTFGGNLASSATYAPVQ